MRYFLLSKGSAPIPIFLVIVLAVLLLGHYYVYVSVLHFFGMAAFDHRVALALILFALPLSFIGSSILAHWNDSLPTRVLYFCSSLWLGVGLTLLTAFTVAWAVWGVATALGRNPGKGWLGLCALGLSLLYSLYGIWNAYHPRLVHCQVRIQNLPPQWEGRTLVQISDIHLGRILRAGFLARVVRQINAQNPAMVLITGDLFDGADGELEKLVAPLNDLKAPLGTFFVTGNHEVYLGVERAYAALRSTPATILADECVSVDGLQVIGISYPERGHALRWEEKLAALDGFDPAQPSVLLYHSPSQVEAAKAAGISLQLSGHVHQGQIFPLQIITRMMFGKYYHGLHREGDFTLYTTSGTGLWGPTLRTGNHPEIPVIHLESGTGTRETKT